MKSFSCRRSISVSISRGSEPVAISMLSASRTAARRRPSSPSSGVRPISVRVVTIRPKVFT